MSTRRNFIKNVTTGSAAALFIPVSLHEELRGFDLRKTPVLSFDNSQNTFEPLEIIKLHSKNTKGTLEIWDNQGNVYHKEDLQNENSFKAGGYTGTQFAIARDKKGAIADIAVFELETKTKIEDEEGKYTRLLNTCHWTMFDWLNGHRRSFVRYNGKVYENFMDWVRDLVWNQWGMQYFYKEIKQGVDLFVDSQREDGMIWDNYKHKRGSDWVRRFEYGNFAYVPEDPSSSNIFVRIPVEADVEYAFVETLYNAWKITGDDEWMQARLDNAIKAINYVTTDPYRWSEKYQLVKRGFTIDTWDFQPKQDQLRTKFAPQGDSMVVKPGQTRFGIFYGDNTGVYNACMILSEMLNYAGRKEEAGQMKKKGQGIKNRLDQLSWNGNFYTHHVPEDPSVERDFGGVDQSKQVSQSNTFSLNRNLPHDQCTSIINTYQKIRKEMPESSPGEWFAIYPPFPKGFHVAPWEYVNGGLSLIACGELIKGAFEHGREKYAVDILNRVVEQSERFNQYLWTNLRGSDLPQKPAMEFSFVDISSVANTNFSGTKNTKAIAWTNEGENDLHEMPTGKQQFGHVEYNIIEPEQNQGAACIGISYQEPYLKEVTIPVNKKTKSWYVLHTLAGDSIAGNMIVNYKDGTEHIIQMNNHHVGQWWYPSNGNGLGGGKNQRRSEGIPKAMVAWEGKNSFSPSIGIYHTGIDNPYPDKEIASLTFGSIKNQAKWFVMGITLSNAEVWFPPSEKSGGMINIEGAAAVTRGLMEGLVGAISTGPAFRKTKLVPRWETAGVSKVKATAKYEASGGYISYDYQLDKKGNQLNILFTGTAHETELELYVPENKSVNKVLVNDSEIKFSGKKVEQSNYIQFVVEGLGVHEVKVGFNG